MNNNTVDDLLLVPINERYANDKKWFKDKLDLLQTNYSARMFSTDLFENGVSRYKKIKTNYDLYNNKINLRDFEYVCKPFGAKSGELPAKMVNRDIISGKIKAFLGMEMKRPFPWKAVAVNPEATSRKEQAQFNKMKEYVVSEITTPIKIQLEQQAQEQEKGRKLTPDEQQQINDRIQQQMQVMTPPEVYKYMERKYQDPAEVQASQLLDYLIQKCDIEDKFNRGLKHGAISAREIYMLGIYNDEPEVWNVNPLNFTCIRSSYSPYIEDSEMCSCIYPMTSSQILSKFGDELTEEEIKKIYSAENEYNDFITPDDTFTFTNEEPPDRTLHSIRVLHGQWKAPRKLGFLTYMDEDGEAQVKIVSDNYTIDKKAGDISLTWRWIPEVYEGFKILDDIYVGMRAVPGQHKDINNLYDEKLSYYGVIYDDTNSIETSLMDRLKQYQYLYDIIMYRIELLMAADKGKKVMMNINAVPTSENVDTDIWKYFFEATSVGFFNPTEEGTGYEDVNTIAKVIDLSLTSDINSYVALAKFVKEQAGEATGLTDVVLGQGAPDEAVTNVKQNLVSTSYILEPYFQLHTLAKKNLLKGLLEKAKFAYRNSGKDKLAYVLDDMSLKMLTLDLDLLDSSSFGIFVTNSVKSWDIMESIKQLAQAALQSQTVQFSDIITILRENNVPEMEETLKAAEENKRQQDQQLQQQQADQQKQLELLKQQGDQKKFEQDKELTILKEEERRKTIIAQVSIQGASFNPDDDQNKNGVNDFIDLAIKERALDNQVSQTNLEKDKFEHQKDNDDKKLALKREELKIKSRMGK